MASALPRLLVLIALMVMPFGMGAAPAASPVDHHRYASAPAEHCPEGKAPADDFGSAPADCAMPCSAALPASDLAPAAFNTVVAAAAQPAIALGLAGVLLEIATPPPKGS